MNIELKKRIVIEGDGHPLLLVHGAGGPKPVEPLRKGLAKYYRVIAPTLLGYLPEDGRIHYSDKLFVEFIETIRQFLQIKQWMVAGVSTGGRIVLNYAVQYPLQVSRLIAISAAGFNTIPPARIAMLRPIFQRLFSWVLSNPKNLAMLGEGEIGDRHNPLVKESTAYMEQLLAHSVSRDNFCEMMLRVLVKKREWESQLPELEMPVCILWGAQDRTCPIAGARRLAALIQHSRLAILDGQGHMAMMEKPDYFVQQIVEFEHTTQKPSTD